MIHFIRVYTWFSMGVTKTKQLVLTSDQRYSFFAKIINCILDMHVQYYDELDITEQNEGNQLVLTSDQRYSFFAKIINCILDMHVQYYDELDITEQNEGNHACHL